MKQRKKQHFQPARAEKSSKATDISETSARLELMMHFRLILMAGFPFLAKFWLASAMASVTKLKMFESEFESDDLKQSKQRLNGDEKKAFNSMEFVFVVVEKNGQICLLLRRAKPKINSS
jgi:hypothetical protein